MWSIEDERASIPKFVVDLLEKEMNGVGHRVKRSEVNNKGVISSEAREFNRELDFMRSSTISII